MPTSEGSSLLILSSSLHENVSVQLNNKSYFEKLRLSVEHYRNDQVKAHATTMNISTDVRNPLDDTLENLIGLNQSCYNKKNIKSQVDIVLSQLYSLKQISIEKEIFEQNIQEHFKYIQLSDNDTRWIYEYHHVDYKEKRRDQLENEQKDRNNVSNPHVHPEYQNSKANHAVSLRSSIHNKHEDSNDNDLYNNNCYIVMAKAVHFRNSSHCFVLDGIDISSRFQYDRNILRDTYHRYPNIEWKTAQEKDNNNSSNIAGNTLSSGIGIDQMTYERLCSDMLSSSVDSKRIVTFILVLCTERMKKIYQLLESLLKPHISSSISVIYVTFEEMKPFLIKYEILSQETESSVAQLDNFKNLIHTDADINGSTPEKNLLGQPPETDDTINKIDVSHEEFFVNSFRSSSLILIFMKQLDKSYILAFIQWYINILCGPDLDVKQSSTSNWNEILKHVWLITSDYQLAETLFNIPKTNLYLWPTEHNDFDHISITISSILALPIVLTVNYEIYTKFIAGISIVDQHCHEITIDRNVCIQMALLRIWSTIGERKTIEIITYDDYLEHFGEYTQMLLSEYDFIHESQRELTHESINGTATLSPEISNEQNHFSYDLIAVSSNHTQKTNSNNELLSSSSIDNLSNPKFLSISANLSEIEKILQENKVSPPYTCILLDQITPITLGVLVGVYQMSIFFENIIRENIFQLNSLKK